MLGRLSLWLLSVLVPRTNDCKHDEATDVAPVVRVNLIDGATFKQLDNHELVVVVTSVARDSSNEAVRTQHTRREDHHEVEKLECKSRAHQHTNHISGPEDPHILEGVKESLIEDESDHETTPTGENSSANLHKV